MGSARPRYELGSSGLVDMPSGIERESSGRTFKRIRLLQIQPSGAAAGRLAVTAAMEEAAKEAVIMAETAGAAEAAGGGGQWLVVLTSGKG